MKRSILGVKLDDAALDACARYRDGDTSEEVMRSLQPLLQAALGWAVDHALNLPNGGRWWHVPRKLTETQRAAMCRLSTRFYGRPEGVALRTLQRLHAMGYVARRFLVAGPRLVECFRLSPAGVRALLWGPR